MNSPAENNLPRLLLASSSPRRQQLLADAGFTFDVLSPTLPEPSEIPTQLGPTVFAEALAYFKARSIFDAHPDRCVLGADTIVAQNGIIYGKPADAEDAADMLAKLSSHPHEVITGVALLTPSQARWITADTTRVYMRPMWKADIADYIATGEWDGKAGAYAIQETADRYVDHIEGSFSNVVGLPMELIHRLMGQLHQTQQQQT